MSKAGPEAGVRIRPAGLWARCRAALALAVAVQLFVGLLVVALERAADLEDLAHTGVADPPTALLSSAGRATGPAEAEEASVPVTPPVADAGPSAVVQPNTAAAAGSTPATTASASAPAGTSDSAQIFARQHPEHAAARQRDDVASSFHWAVIVGVNDYMGRTSSTIGSVGDAYVLRDTLYRNGWRGDQVLTLTDHEATHDQIVRAIEWLIRSTDRHSTVIFSFSGHMRHNEGVTAVWPADNQFIWAGDLGRMLGAVQADRSWVSLQGCHAAGLAAPGLEGENRLVTYASGVQEKAYEDPATRQSVMGYYLFAEGLRDGRGGHNGRSSVQQAFAWAAPQATSKTAGQQPYGAQRPVLVDGLGGREFALEVTGAPRAPGATTAPTGPTGSEGDERPGRRPLVTVPDGLFDLLPGS